VQKFGAFFNSSHNTIQNKAEIPLKSSFCSLLDVGKAKKVVFKYNKNVKIIELSP
jgi:hypothetical protein